ncbi:MAG TPA: tetratricopeptide repeat protein [Alphaproteobacteria bacterium]|nr:tetratricopeptide repeat protein [Alphaproteobacteria bacterium]
MTRRTAPAPLAAAALALALLAAPALGMGDLSNMPAAPSDPLAAAEALIKQEKYAEAIPDLREAARLAPKNADVFNWLGYTHRKTGQYDAALGYYTQALTLDPRHKGAHEYLGELYLETRQLPKAEALLANLATICTDCEEYQELAEAVAKFKAAQPKS